MKAAKSNLKTIKSLHRARRDDVADLITYQPIPISPGNLERLEPFIFLNHHGFQVYPPNNQGLPFGPHPHRGFETVTFILKGDLIHKDTGGYESLIKAGGVQWMTAGSGLIHAEVSSDEFKENGGELEILQLWLNLPAKLKMTEPRYRGLQKNEIPKPELDNGKVTVELISGELNEAQGAFQPLTDVFLSIINFQPGGKFRVSVASDKSVLFYVVNGKLTVNGKTAETHTLVEFNYDGETIEMEAQTDAVLLFGYAPPNNEPIAAYGPFVMNTREEIGQAIKDYQAGKFGIWKS